MLDLCRSETLVMIFWKFTTFQCKFALLQAKQNFISSIADLVYELTYNLLRDLKLRNDLGS